MGWERSNSSADWTDAGAQLPCGRGLEGDKKGPLLTFVFPGSAWCALSSLLCFALGVDGCRVWALCVELRVAGIFY